MIHLHPFETFAPAAVNEAHFGDMIGEGYLAFIEKYRVLVKKKKIDPTWLYVQFSNFKDNGLDRTAHGTPDHHDPVGNYAYPLSYVLAHPADIWYGAHAKHARVLKDMSTRKLVLSNIESESDVMHALRTMKVSRGDAERAILVAAKEHKDKLKGKTRWGKLLFAIVQHEVAPWRPRAQQAQTDLLLTGYDAIEDRSRSIPLAIINDREPEQICFLKRSAFRVVAVERLSGETKKSITSTDVPRRKFASQIAHAIGDKLIGKEEESMFWTVGGRRIYFTSIKHDSYYVGLKIGKKHHRKDRDFTKDEITITVTGEYGAVRGSYHYAQTFADILADFAGRWQKATERGADPAWEPETSHAVYKEKEARVNAAQRDQEYRDDVKRLEADVPNFLEVIGKWNLKCQQPFALSDEVAFNAEAAYWLTICLRRAKLMGKHPASVQQSFARYTQGAGYKGITPTSGAYCQRFIQFLAVLFEEFPDLYEYTIERFYRAGEPVVYDV